MSITLAMTGSQARQAVAAPRADASESWEALVKRLQERQEGALELLIERSQQACSRLALSILKDPELSQDALQEAYFVVYQRIGQLREATAFKSWLFRIVNHCCLDILRRRSKEQEIDFQQRPDLDRVEPHSDLSEEVNRQHKIRATFEKLPEIDRTALALREVCSMSYEEMSQVLGIPLGTVRSRLAKARKRFIDCYQGGVS